jgi:hypothetical protein
MIRLVPTTAVLGLDGNKGLSAIVAAVNPLEPFKPRIAVCLLLVFKKRPPVKS